MKAERELHILNYKCNERELHILKYKCNEKFNLRRKLRDNYNEIKSRIITDMVVAVLDRSAPDPFPHPFAKF